MNERDDNGKKRKWPRRVIAGGAVIVVLAGLSLLAGIRGIEYLVDIWWFDAMGYGFYYWQRMLYRYAVFAAVAVLFFLIFFLNFRIAAGFAANGGRRGSSPAKGSDSGTKPYRAASVWLSGLLSAALGIAIALPLFRQWERFLFFIFGPEMGSTDPFLGRDISFYLFSFPVYSLIQRRLLLAVLVMGAGILVIYLMNNRARKQPLLQFPRGPRLHLNLMVSALFALGIWEFMLQRYALVYDTSHQALFYGPGYVQMHVVLPAIWICAVALGLCAVAMVIFIQTGKGFRYCVIAVAVLSAAMALRYTDFLPRMVQRYVVEPNEIEKESPYIGRHVRATLDAYKLNGVEVRDFTTGRFSSKPDDSVVDEVLRNIPVWDAEVLVEVFQQLQELRTYYMFPRVSVGRYTIGGRQQQVFLSPREIEYDNLPGGARNWINEHLTYTHGFGAVMTPASQASGSAMTWYLHNIPPESAYGLSMKQPRIYYGLGDYNYSIVPNRAGEMDYPKGEKNVTSHYDGRGGVPISSLFKKFLFAYYLKNRNLFFSTKITEESKLLFRRNVIDRIRHLTPFLKLDGSPYAVVTADGIYWMVDAYTVSDLFPASAPRTLEGERINYMRNAVKIVVDAYHGTVRYYIYDDSDPIIRTYDRIYPGLFRPRDSMPESLQPHVRYPVEFFDLQMQIYAKYHQRDPQVFYQQEDLWTFAEELEVGSVPLRPYYVSLDLIESGQMEFMLLLPMFPKNRHNLRAVALAGCDPDRYGKLVVYNFPKGELVYGPAQIDALINQDPKIAEQFTLWDQAGSQIVRGKMIILPVGGRVLFIQPVYLKATSRVKIPELQRIIMSEGDAVVMEKSVWEAYAELQRRASASSGSGFGETKTITPPPEQKEEPPIPKEAPGNEGGKPETESGDAPGPGKPPAKPPVGTEAQSAPENP